MNTLNHTKPCPACSADQCSECPHPSEMAGERDVPTCCCGRKFIPPAVARARQIRARRDAEELGG